MVSSFRYLPAGFLVLLCVVSCNNEVLIDAPYQEKTLIWCLLDAGETQHYLRIQKSFLQTGTDAYTLALDPANIYYTDGQLEVYVEEWKNDTLTNTFTSHQVNGDTLGIPKQEGFFANVPNILYTFTANIDSASQYKLFVINHTSGDTLTAQTEIVHPFKPLSPNATTVAMEYADTGKITYQCRYAINGKIYELMMDFVYAEKNTLTGDSSVYSIPWQIFNSQLADNITGYGNIAHEIPLHSFFTFVANNITQKENVQRTFLHLNFTFYAGAPALYYLYLNGFAQTGLTQLYATNPYTNINGGFGIFSSRYAVEIDDIGLTPNSIDSLACGLTTRHLHFSSSVYNPFYPGCF